MSTKAIRTLPVQASCDVCGRTLLRGERAEIYVSGGQRRSVCELCTPRALHGGWVREGELPAPSETGVRGEHRRSLLARLRGSGRGDVSPREDQSARAAARRRRPLPPLDHEQDGGAAPHEPDSAPGPRTSPAARAAARAAARLGPGREPRHVHAVPASAEHRISSAVALFNQSEHTRTIAGVARSLGLPEVSVHPSEAAGSVVWLVVSWELCWYRYEADLSDEVPHVRVTGQGYELSELSEIELRGNAVADERGRLALA